MQTGHSYNYIPIHMVLLTILNIIFHLGKTPPEEVGLMQSAFMGEKDSTMLPLVYKPSMQTARITVTEAIIQFIIHLVIVILTFNIYIYINICIYIYFKTMK